MACYLANLPRSQHQTHSRCYSIHCAQNFYFLIIAVLSVIPNVSPKPWFVSVAPLAFVLTVSAVKEAYEDFVSGSKRVYGFRPKRHNLISRVDQTPPSLCSVLISIPFLVVSVSLLQCFAFADFRTQCFFDWRQLIEHFYKHWFAVERFWLRAVSELNTHMMYAFHTFSRLIDNTLDLITNTVLVHVCSWQQRYQMDKEVNNTKVLRWDGTKFIHITWQARSANSSQCLFLCLIVSFVLSLFVLLACYHSFLCLCGLRLCAWFWGGSLS